MVAQRTITPTYLHHERIYFGIDLAKINHVAGVISKSLLQNCRFEQCPTLTFTNSRTGFEELVNFMLLYARTEHCSVLLENTGHYGYALIAYLQEHGVAVFNIHAARTDPKTKTDKRDALRLGNMLYNQRELGVQISETDQTAHEYAPATNLAQQLRGLTHHRSKLVREATQRKNALTAICDEIFPEFTDAIKDVNGTTALALRLAYPTAADVANATVDELLAARPPKTRNPGRAKITLLQTLARQSIGSKNPHRLQSLVFRQRQIIAELRQELLHIAEIEAEFERIMAGSRELKILKSIPCIGDVQAAYIIGGIGNIGNFEIASKLRGYCGWSPKISQTGKTKDSMKLGKGGNKILRQAIFFIAWRAVQEDTEWRAVHDRLVPKICHYNGKLNRYEGKNKVTARICSQIVGVIYHLLKKDYEMLQKLKPGDAIPEPELYDRSRHHAHHAGS